MSNADTAIFVDYDTTCFELKALCSRLGQESLLASMHFTNAPADWISVLAGAPTDAVETRLYANPKLIHDRRRVFEDCGAVIVECPKRDSVDAGAQTALTADLVAMACDPDGPQRFIVLAGRSDYVAAADRLDDLERGSIIYTVAEALAFYEGIQRCEARRLDHFAALLIDRSARSGGKVDAARLRKAYELLATPVFETANAPRMAYNAHGIIFRAIAEYTARDGDFQLRTAIAFVRERALRQALRIRGESIGFVLRGLSYAQVDLSKPQAARALAEAYQRNLEYLVRNRGYTLTDAQRAALRVWLGLS